MNSKIVMSSDVISDDVVEFLANRHKCTPEEVVNRYLVQDGFLPHSAEDSGNDNLEKNELAILREMHLLPTSIEFI